MLAPIYIASELEKLSAHYGSPILIDNFTRELVKDQFHIRQIDVVTLKDNYELLAVYEILGTSSQDLKHDIMTVNATIILDYDLL